MVIAKRKICVVTGTRAEYGLLRWVIDGILNSCSLELQLIATGMHLSPEFGLTVQEIEADGYHINRKVEMLLSSDTPVGVTKSMGLGMIGFADALNDLQPDLLLLLGDRFEAFVAASSALVAQVPVAHLHGGETTEGAIDEAMRHSITKMSHLHFVATEEYANRVIQLGEDPQKVFQVGGLGVDSIRRVQLLGRAELESAIDFQLKSKNFLITFHPVTLEKNTSSQQIDELLSVLSSFKEIGLIFTMPNADTDGRIVREKITNFCQLHANAKAFESLGQLRYLSCVNQVDAVIGNSSSGLAEVPSFKKATINIGDRQKGRLKAASIIDCEPSGSSIRSAIELLFSDSFQELLLEVKNPYGEGGASLEIVSTLEKYSLSDFSELLKKPFFDLAVQA